jgi:hypothetical protein
MPQKPIDYSNTIIYELRCKDPSVEEVYVGSTTNYRKRKNSHKEAVVNPNNNNYTETKYDFIRSNGGWENWIMTPLEKYPCKDNIEARLQEQEWIKKYDKVLNIRYAFRTDKQYELDTGRFEIIPCECGGRYNDKHKTRHMKTQKHNNFLTSNI